MTAIKHLILDSKKKVITQFLLTFFVALSVYGAYIMIPKQRASMQPYSSYPIHDMSMWWYVGIALLMLIPGVYVFMRLKRDFKDMDVF